MTYTETNRSFVSSILEPYFKEAGLKIPQEQFSELVQLKLNIETSGGDSTPPEAKIV